MKNYLSILFLAIFLTGCATGNKFGQETCKDIHGQFTKAVKCLELKFVSLNPKKNEEYKDTYDLTVNNPNAVEDIDNRTPQEIIEKLEQLERQESETLNTIKELL